MVGRFTKARALDKVGELVIRDSKGPGIRKCVQLQALALNPRVRKRRRGLGSHCFLESAIQRRRAVEEMNSQSCLSWKPFRTPISSLSKICPLLAFLLIPTGFHNNGQKPTQ